MPSKQSRQPRGHPDGRARGGDDLDLGPLPGLLGYQLRLAQLAVFRDFERSAGGLGVSPGRFGLLALVEANPGVSQSRLAHAVGLDRSTMVAVLDQLEGRELVDSVALVRTGGRTACGSRAKGNGCSPA